LKRRPVQTQLVVMPTEVEAQARVAMRDVRSFKVGRKAMTVAIVLCVRGFNTLDSNAKEPAISRNSSRVVAVVLAALLKELDASGWQNGILFNNRILRPPTRLRGQPARWLPVATEPLPNHKLTQS
jgi:hypothetical protein